MKSPVDQLSPRQRDCLKLVWERRATSKEIAKELGISKWTVDSYIAEAVEALGASDRRDAAALAFGDFARTGSGGDAVGVSASIRDAAVTEASADNWTATRPWKTRNQPRNTLTIAQTLGWIAAIAIGSLASLALASSVANGLPSVVWPLIDAVQRLTR